MDGDAHLACLAPVGVRAQAALCDTLEVAVPLGGRNADPCSNASGDRGAGRRPTPVRAEGLAQVAPARAARSCCGRRRAVRRRTCCETGPRSATGSQTRRQRRPPNGGPVPVTRAARLNGRRASASRAWITSRPNAVPCAWKTLCRQRVEIRCAWAALSGDRAGSVSRRWMKAWTRSYMMRPRSGRVSFQGQDVTALPLHKRARLGIGRTFQTPVVPEDLTVAEVYKATRQAHRSYLTPDDSEWGAGLMACDAPGAAIAEQLDTLNRRKLLLSCLLMRRPALPGPQRRSNGVRSCASRARPRRDSRA